jgi:hypothetical protein
MPSLMLITVMIVIAAALQPLPGLAGDIGRMLETNEEARQRQGAEAWQRYEQRRYLPPLGGYRERLGDPWQPGAERPGYRPDRDDAADGIGGGWPSSREEPY